uniref:DUF1963 domain-containing protein n=1 Tax=Gelidibacter sp. TaxID=2018083 RepID=UPI00404A6D33
MKKLIYQKISELFPNDSEKIKNLLSFSIGLEIDMNNQTEKLKSKFGGFPDVKEGFEWPYIESRPLTFLCQINLEQISNYVSTLPKNGIIYFFIAPLDEEEYPKVTNMIKVIFEEKNDFQPVNFDFEFPALDEFSISFYEHYTIPSYQEREILEYNFDYETSNSIDELQCFINELTHSDECISHHLIGYPNAVQGSVRIFWASKLLNPFDNYFEEIDKDLQKFQKVGDDFELLLQINLEDDRINIPNLGENCLYFGILKQDLLEKKFDRVKLVIQST